MFRVTQFSDMHFCTDPEAASRNTDDTWDAVFADAFDSGRPLADLVVITGDIAVDGSVTSEAHLVGEDRWPSSPLPEISRRMLRDEISYEEMKAQLAAEQA